MFEKIIDAVVEGVEFFSSYHSPSITEHYLKCVADKDLIITMGSDFHGKTKPSIHLGRFNLDDEEKLTHRFMARLKKR